jgi:osmotically-inducible protein OsmY
MANHRNILIIAGLIGLLGPGLQGCVPVIVAGAAGVGVMMADDKRTAGTYIEDQNIELKASGQIREAYKDGVHADVTSFNQKVLITGEVPNEEIRQKIGEVVRGVENVREVVNELAIAGTTSFTARSDDSLLTAKVKGRIIEDGTVNPNHVKVVSSKGVVYLMGLLSRKDAEQAAQIASKTNGVLKVVKVFEYTD